VTADTAPPAEQKPETQDYRYKRSNRSRRRSKTKKEEPQQAPPRLPSDERIMLINVSEGEESRIAIVHNGRLEELFLERAKAGSHVGNIYKGVVTNVEPSIQAAFIDFGLAKNGFLHISDLQPQYFPDGKGRSEQVGRKTPRRERPPIQKCLRRGQEVMVQIIKEGIGSKGPTLTTYLSIPGRYLVMMPGMNRLGVSRKIEDEDTRRKMRKVLEELDLPQGMGFILRTAGLDKTKRELQRDQMYLQRLWTVVARRVKNEKAPCELYQETDLVIRTIRDVYSSDFSRIIVDDMETAEKVRDFLAIAMPRTSAPVELYDSNEPIFHKYNVEEEMERLYDRHVSLPSGASLVIDSSEAMVTIDVNSGRFRDIDDAEESAYRINLEAAEEIARQLRLRDLGGLILCDFIDMRYEKNRRGVERALREALKNHKERAKCLRMSQFGIIEMTRQRMRPAMKRNIYRDCPHCRGTGLIKTTESITLDIMRHLQLAAHHKQVARIEVRTAPAVATEILNRKRSAIYTLEGKTNSKVRILPDNTIGTELYRFDCFDQRGSAIRVIEHKADTSRVPDKHRPSKPAETRPAEEPFELEEVFE
jgi:ribonuclease E